MSRIQKYSWGIAYYKKDELHREDGPAVIYDERSGYFVCIEYRIDNNLHRLDGPAYISFNMGYIDYYIGGLGYTESDYYKKILK